MVFSRVKLSSRKNVIRLDDDKQMTVHVSIGLARTTSVQSDSSGFADADNTLDNIQSIDLDWESLKVAQLGSGEEHDGPITGPETSGIRKKDVTMAMKGRDGGHSPSRGILRKGKVVSEKKVIVSESERSGTSSPSYVAKAFLDPDNRQVSLSDVSEVFLSLDGGEIKEVKNKSKSESDSPKSKPKYKIRYSDNSDDVFDGHSILSKTDSMRNEASGSPLLQKVPYDSIYTDKAQHKITADVHQDFVPKQTQKLSHAIARRQQSAPTPSGVNEMNNLSFAEELEEYSKHSDLVVPTVELKVVSPDGKDVKVIPLKQRLQATRKTKSLQDREIQTDEIAQPELLVSLLKQSGGWTPDLELLANQGSWTLAKKGQKMHFRKHLYDENELVRQAVDKYKDDLRILEVQAATLYALHRESLADTESDKEIESLHSIRRAIWHELNTMTKLLRDRRYSLNGAPDMASLTGLSVVQMMISLLKEQLFHNNTLDMMEYKESHVTDGGHVTRVGDASKDDNRDDLMRRLAEVQQSVAKQHGEQADEMANSLQLFRDSLLAEIKASIQKETHQLHEQVKATERQIHQLNTQLSISSLNSSQEYPDHYVDQYTAL